MKRSIEKRNKLFLGIFILLVSIYFSTGVHELGHSLAMKYYGCEEVIPFIEFPFPYGGTLCHNDTNFTSNLEKTNIIGRKISLISGPLFVSVIGMLLFALYILIHHRKFMKSNYSLNMVLYFFAFGSLSNGFLQALSSVDLSRLIEYGFNQFYSYLFSLIIGILIIYQLFLFKDLLKITEPTISKKELEIISKAWTFLVVLYFAIYLFVPLFY